MTPKEKAKELFDKMCLAIATESTEFGYYTNVVHAKKCALIAVEEILKNNLILFEDSLNDIYWQEVEYEIEKL
jgi:arginine/lysine/ornithine decarboxylase